MMSMVLENIPTTAIVARATILSVYRTAQLISAVPNISYYKKAFPEALFHQLILAMVHPDPETRVGAHCIFSVVLLPSLDCFWSDPNRKTSVALSGFYSSAAASQKSRRSIFVHSGGECQTDVMDEGMNEERNQNMDMGVLNNTVCPSHSFKLSSPYVVADGKEEVISLRLSSQQVGLLLSSIWVQATLTENAPTNYEAMSHSYILVLLFSLTKNSSHVALVRCFQLAFSLRSISLDQEGGLQLSRRRSLFTLASAMLIFSAKAANLPELVPYVKASLTHETVDPFLELVDDMKLQAVYTLSNSEKTISCSKEDEVMASKSLSEVEADDEKLREIVSSHFLKKSKDEFSGIKEQLLEGFSPDDVYPLGAALFLETPRPCSPLAEMVFQAFNEIMPASTLTDDEAFNEDSGNQSDRTSLAINTLDILSVNQLLDSVLETARQVATYPLSTTPIPYDQMKNQCEALVMGKHQKMSTLLSLKNQQEAKGVIGFSKENEKKRLAFLTMKMEIVEKVRGQDQMSCSTEYEQSFRLPPSSPYDKFLKAAGDSVFLVNNLLNPYVAVDKSIGAGMLYYYLMSLRPHSRNFCRME
ncbi:hypothetical protein GIB67_009187 [Kingdonia uniflora]|uniref:Uncharacterized protein n=1 Tax=Kingdonia uniflora TaxID=39325 RepID=A0A7J7N2P7_9MAGN|nr:hypothetical protein GIB67_009187 [Kingdonia uniflora]